MPGYSGVACKLRLPLVAPTVTRVNYGLFATIFLPLTPERSAFVSGVLKLHLKPLNFVSRTVHRGPVLLRVAGWAGTKLCKKIVHGSPPWMPGMEFSQPV